MHAFFLYFAPVVFHFSLFMEHDGKPKNKNKKQSSYSGNLVDHHYSGGCDQCDPANDRVDNDPSRAAGDATTPT